jgi:hypothetical protein
VLRCALCNAPSHPQPKAQKHAYEHRALEYLLPLLAPPAPYTPPANPAHADDAEAAYAEQWTVVVKALTATSSLVRCDDTPALKDQLIECGIVGHLCTLLRTAHCIPRVQSKLFSMLQLVLQWFPATKVHLVPLIGGGDILPRLIAHIGKSDDINQRESCVKCLCEFARLSGTTKDVAAAKELRNKQFGLKDIIKHRLKEIKTQGAASKDDKAMLEDEETHLHTLSKLCKF